MKIIHTIGGIAQDGGGPSRSVPCLCRALAEAGEEVWLLSHSQSADKPPCLASAQLVFGPGVGLAQAKQAIGSLAARVLPDIIHDNSLWMMCNHAVSTYARAKGIPLVVSPRGTLAPWALNYKKWKKRAAWHLYQRRDLARAAAFHVTSEEELRQVRQQGFRQPVLLVPNGVDVPESTIELRARGAARQRRVLYLGRIHFQKGLRELITAWTELKRGTADERVRTGAQKSSPRFPAWQLELVGPDVAGHQAQLVVEAEKLGLKVATGKPSESPDILFTGPLDDEKKWVAYARADVVVLPSYTENFGMTVVEGLAASRPVITTKGTPWAELMGNSESSKFLKCESAKVRESVTANGANQANNDNFRTLEISNSITSSGRCGWWIDLGVDPLVQALREAMGLEDDARDALGRNGRRLVEVKYSWRAVACEMKRAYAWLLRGGDRPCCVRLD